MGYTCRGCGREVVGLRPHKKNRRHCYRCTEPGEVQVTASEPDKLKKEPSDEQS